MLAEGRRWWEVTARHLRQGVISMSPVHAPRAGPQNLSHIQMLDKCLIRIVRDKYMCWPKQVDLVTKWYFVCCRGRFCPFVGLSYASYIGQCSSLYTFHTSKYLSCWLTGQFFLQSLHHNPNSTSPENSVRWRNCSRKEATPLKIEILPVEHGQQKYRWLSP